MYICRLLYQNLTVTTNEKSIIDIHTKKKKESKHNTKDSNQITKEENKRRKGKKKTYKNKSKTINKMAISTYISIITLNVNGLNAPPKDTHWLNGYQNKTCIFAAYKLPTSVLETHTN